MAANDMAGYQPGDKGTIIRETVVALSRQRYYLVAMDKDNPDAKGTVFTEEEIEPDT
jgi:hypothetical protein